MNIRKMKIEGKHHKHTGKLHFEYRKISLEKQENIFTNHKTHDTT